MEQIQNRLASLWEREPFRFNGGDVGLANTAWNPRVDILEEEKEFVVKAEIPEMKKEDLKVSLEDHVLSIAGERQMEKEEKNKKYHRVEREYGSFIRSFALPDTASGDKITAEYKDGVLKVHVPKDGKSAGRSVEIKVG
jgi:HSP20 family protein